MEDTSDISLQSWAITYDPYDYEHSKDWIENVVPDEDILQMHHRHRNLILDVGCYGDYGDCGDYTYCIFIVKDENWQQPVKKIEVKRKEDLPVAITDLLKRFSD